MKTHLCTLSTKALTLITGLVVLSAPLALWAEGEKIASRALTPREIKTYNLPADLITSGGLMTVGIGEPVYLEVNVPKGAEVTSVSWVMDSTTSFGSNADFQTSPLTSDMPIYSVGDREVSDAYGRTLFVPDKAGKYFISAHIGTPAGTVVVSDQITAAEYVGVGTMGFANPAYPQCALCHEEQSLNYMDTNHSSAFKNAIDGVSTTHFQERCISCHALGYDSELENGSFFDVADDTQWVFPTSFQAGNWDSMPLELQAKSNVQCESCHGAGGEHHGDSSATSVTLSAGDCGKCHDAEPYHTKNSEWNLSAHAVATRYPSGEGRESCVGCHSGWGYIDRTDGAETFRTEYEAITCAVCHDPHSGENHHQIRTVETVVLKNGYEITEGGTGKLCMNCHQARRNGEEFALKYSSRFNPHYGPQADMLIGTNAVEFGQTIPSSRHIYATEDACATCHMPELNSADPANHLAGGHTFKVSWDNDTPDDPSDDVDIVKACVDCHGPMESFDIVNQDYNLDGTYEGVQTEVTRLMDTLAMKLPPYGVAEIAVAKDFTTTQLQAAYNHSFIYYDGSKGIHNTKYTVGLLKASIAALDGVQNHVLGGINVPVGGVWYYSPWFDYYRNIDNTEWIDSWELGLLKVTGSAEAMYFYDPADESWFFTSESMYPAIYSFKRNQWFSYASSTETRKWYFNYNTGAWFSITK